MPEHRHIRSLGIEREGQAYFFGYDEGPEGPGQVRLETLYSGLSAGTELTFLKHTNPYFHSRWDESRGLFLAGQPGLHYPVPFLGYMEVGRVIASQAPGFAVGDVVAGTFGHKTGHTADPFHEVLNRLPKGLDPILGIFVAQMGPIAANGILHADAELGGAGANRLGAGISGRPVAVVGAGTVGIFTALFARRAGASEVVVCDPSPFRREKAEKLGLTAMTEDDAVGYAKSAWHGNGGADRGADIVFQTRAQGESLHNALRMLRPQGTVIDLAFYQGGAGDLRLGEEFHHHGLTVRCAQISRMPRGFAPLWDRRRLAGETLRLLESEGERIKAELITHVVLLDEAPAFLAALVSERPDFMQVVFKAAS